MKNEDDKQALHAAAILLAAAVGQTHEPANQKQVMIAVENARKLYADPVQQLRVTANRAIPSSAHLEVASIRRKTRTRKQDRQRNKLVLPDLEHVKSAVIVTDESMVRTVCILMYRHSVPRVANT